MKSVLIVASLAVVTSARPTFDNIKASDFGTFPSLPSGQYCPMNLQGPPPPETIANLNWGMTDYNNARVWANSDSDFSLSLQVQDNIDQDPQGSRIVSKQAYTKGKVVATIESGALIPGVVAAFYLSNDEPRNNLLRSQDEVDFELMGARGAAYVQTNYFTGGYGWKEIMHKIDHTKPVTYTMEWDITKGATLTMQPQGGEAIVRKIVLANGEQWRPMRVYISFWGSKLCNAVTDAQLLRWAGLPPASARGSSYTMKVSNFQLTGESGYLTTCTVPTPDAMKNELKGMQNLARTLWDAAAPFPPQTYF